MYYLTQASDIKFLIDELTDSEILWLDTEVADYKTKKPRLSLIQVLANPQDLTGSRTCMIDVLEQPELVKIFIDKIMTNPTIEKVFHNAAYDLKFLGQKKAVNVTCTLEMARKIPYHFLPVAKHTLKYLTEYLTEFKNISKEEQGSDWGIRPLTTQQLEYAKMDCVYLAQVHINLLAINEKNQISPQEEDLNKLGQRYLEIESQWRLLDSEMEYLKDRVKQAMSAQKIKETAVFKLSSSQRTTIKVDFDQLAKLAIAQGIDLDFDVTLTKEIQGQLGTFLAQLPIQEQKIDVAALKTKTSDGDEEK